MSFTYFAKQQIFAGDRSSSPRSLEEERKVMSVRHKNVTHFEKKIDIKKNYTQTYCNPF